MGKSRSPIVPKPLSLGRVDRLSAGGEGETPMSTAGTWGSGRISGAGISTPAGTLRALEKALCGGDATAAAAYFSPKASLLTPDGTEIVGRRQIYKILMQLIGPDRGLKFDSPRILVVDRVAICSQRWTINSEVSGVDPFERAFASTMALHRRGTEGPWEILIAQPWGAGSLVGKATG